MNILLIYLEPLDNEHMGLLYIGTVLKEAGHKVKIIGTERFFPLQKILKEISRFKAQVIGISIPTALVNTAQKIAKFIRQNFPEIKIIAGGPHPTILPFETMQDGNIDICVLGEGELTVIDLIKAISENGPLDEIPGIAYLKGKDLVVTKNREYIDDLDSLPFVDRELLPREIIYGRAGYPLGNPCMLLITIRGCPFRCSFCQPALSKMFGPKIRRRSAENVIAEITMLKKRYGLGGLWILDDTFLIDRNWTEKFCDYMIKEKLNILWHANGRLNRADEDILIKMREAGCVGLVMTPETGSERIRNEILNKGISDEETLGFYKICKKIGIPFQANIMFGSPTETNDELKSSLDLIRKIQPHFMNLSYTTALPGTYLYEKYLDEIKSSAYYRTYENYDIGKLKRLDCDIPDSHLKEAMALLRRLYDRMSFGNRARHFFEFPYFRKILYKRWRTLIFNRHPKFRHFIFDILAIIFGSIIYLKNIRAYKSEIK